MKIFVIGLLFVMCIGCVSISSKDGKFKYTRYFGTQKIGRFEGEISEDGSKKVMFEKQQADSTALLNAINNLAQAYLKTQGL